MSMKDVGKHVWKEALRWWATDTQGHISQDGNTCYFQRAKGGAKTLCLLAKEPAARLGVKL